LVVPATSRHTPRKRGIQYAADFRFHCWRLGILDHPLSRMMTAEGVAHCAARSTAHSRQKFSQIQNFKQPRVPPEFYPDRCAPGDQRAQGMPGAQCARSLVCNENKHTSVVTTVTPEITRHSPRNGFTAYFVFSPVNRAFLPPSSARLLADLTPASGCQNDTTWPYASASFVRLAIVRLTPPRPPHPMPNVRDDREAPLLWARDGSGYASDLGRAKTKIFLQKGLDTISENQK